MVKTIIKLIIFIIILSVVYLLTNLYFKIEKFENDEKDENDKNKENKKKDGGFFSSIKGKFSKNKEDDEPIVDDDPDGSKLLKKLNEDKEKLMRPTFCKQPLSGLTLGLGCIKLQDSTDCHAWTSGWDKICRKEFKQDEKNLNTGVKPYTSQLPSQDVYGRVIKYEGGCKTNPIGAIPGVGGLLNVGQQKGRSVCAKGWGGGAKLLHNSTQCKCSDEGNLNTHCNNDYGEGKGIGPGYPAEKQTGIKKKYRSGCPKNEFHCPWYKKAMIGTAVFGVIGMGATSIAAGAKKPQRAQCELGWYNGAKLRKNSTQCHRWEQLRNWPYYKGDKSCRWIFKSKNCASKPSHSCLPHKSWGMKSRYKGGCWRGGGRAECAQGYTNFRKIRPYSTKCRLWTDNFGWRCRQTYGENYDAVSKYNGGCDTGQGRGQCVYDNSPIGTKKNGKKCGLWSWIKNKWCVDDYGKNWKKVGRTGKGCAWGQGKAVCQKYKVTSHSVSPPMKK